MATINPNYIPPASTRSNTISMDNRRQYDYITTTAAGVTAEFKGYPFQVVDIKPGDVILLHISDDLDLRQCINIQRDMNEEFPDNKVVLCNEHVLKGLTVLRGETKKIDDVVDIKMNVDIDTLFDHIMKGNPNDFLLSGQNPLR